MMPDMDQNRNAASGRRARARLHLADNDLAHRHALVSAFKSLWPIALKAFPSCRSVEPNGIRSGVTNRVRMPSTAQKSTNMPAVSAKLTVLRRRSSKSISAMRDIPTARRRSASSRLISAPLPP